MMDINSLAAEFGTAPASTIPDNQGRSEPTGIDIHGLAAEFGSDRTARDISKTQDRVRPVYIYPPLPPISGATKEESDTINAQPSQQGIVNPRSQEPFPLDPRKVIPDVVNAISDSFKSGLKNVSGGLGDIVNESELKSGAKRMGIGALQAVTAIPSGIATGAVSNPVTQLTGNPDIGDRAGFVAGAAIPIVPGLSTLAKIAPSKVALKDLVDTITNKGANPENLVNVVQGMKANPRLGPADLNPAVLSTAQKLFTTEGDTAKNYLAKTSGDRMSTTKDTVSGALDSALGETVNVSDKLEQLKEAARKVGREKINPIIAGTPSIDITGVVKDIDNEIGRHALKAMREGTNSPLVDDTKRALFKLRNDLRGDWPDRDQMFSYTDTAHRVQSQLRETAENLNKSTSGWEKQTGKKLMEFREKIKDAIGPEYKKALSSFKDEKDIEKAFRYGHDEVLKSGKSLEHDPSFFEKTIKDFSENELEAAKEGARRAMDAEINGTRSAATNPASKAIAIGQNEFSKERITALLGKEEADKLFTSLEHARLEANTHNKIVEGSQTAMRMAGESKVALTPPKAPQDAFHRLATMAAYAGPEIANFYGTGYALPGVGLAASLGAGAISKGATYAKNKVTRALELERNAQSAKLALPVAGPERDALIKSLEAAIPGPKQSIVRRSAHTLSRFVAP